MGNPDAVNQDKHGPAASAPEAGGVVSAQLDSLVMRGEGTDAAARPEVRAPALRWRRAFPGDHAQIGALRRWLEWLLPPCPARDDLVSVAVELSTNALRHTANGNGGQFAVEVTWSAEMARVAVYDGGAPNGPRVIEDPLGEDGRGLLMVNALSVRRGVSGNAQGRVVWADILWAGPAGPGQPEFPGGFASAIREAEADLTCRYPGVLIWFGSETWQWWALPSWPGPCGLVSASSPQELAQLLDAMDTARWPPSEAADDLSYARARRWQQPGMTATRPRMEPTASAIWTGAQACFGHRSWGVPAPSSLTWTSVRLAGPRSARTAIQGSPGW